MKKNMFCMKWEDARIAGFKMYKWNERLVRNNVSQDHGIFVFRRHHDSRIIRIIRFRLRFLMNPNMKWLSRDFQARPDGLGFSSVLLRSGFFWMRGAERLVKELAAFTRASFEFSGFTACCPWAPRLVFVVDFSYTPVLHGGCPPSALPEVTRFETPICTEPHDEPKRVVSDDGEEEACLQFCHSFETDDEADPDEVDSGDSGRVVGPDDVEAAYSDEMRELVRGLRRYRNVGRTFPLAPLSPLDPVGLIEVHLPVMETLTATTIPPYFECPICVSEMEEGEVVIRTKCGHVFHKDCAIQWLSTRFTCPSCRSYSIKPL